MREGGKLKASERRVVNVAARKQGKEKESTTAAKIARLRELKAQRLQEAAAQAEGTQMPDEAAGSSGGAGRAAMDLR